MGSDCCVAVNVVQPNLCDQNSTLESQLEEMENRYDTDVQRFQQRIQASNYFYVYMKTVQKHVLLVTNIRTQSFNCRL